MQASTLQTCSGHSARSPHMNEQRRTLLNRATGVMVGLLAVARAVTALGRESFIPPIFSLVSAKLGTPIFTTAILGIVTGE